MGPWRAGQIAKAIHLLQIREIRGQKSVGTQTAARDGVFYLATSGDLNLAIDSWPVSQVGSVRVSWPPVRGTQGR